MPKSENQTILEQCVHCGSNHGTLPNVRRLNTNEYRKELGALSKATTEFVREYLDHSTTDHWRHLTKESFDFICAKIKDCKTVSDIASKEFKGLLMKSHVADKVPMARIVRWIRESTGTALSKDVLHRYVNENTDPVDQRELLSEIFPSLGSTYDDSYWSLLNIITNTPQTDLSGSLNTVWRQTAQFLAEFFGYRLGNYTFFHHTEEKEASGFVYSPEWIQPFKKIKEQHTSAHDNDSNQFEGLDSLLLDTNDTYHFADWSQGALIRWYFAAGVRGVKIKNLAQGCIRSSESQLRERSFHDIIGRRTEFERQNQVLLVPDGEMSYRALELYVLLRSDWLEKPCNVSLDDSTQKFLANMGLIRKDDAIGDTFHTTHRSYRMLKWLKDVTGNDAVEAGYSIFQEREPYLHSLNKNNEMQTRLSQWLIDCESAEGCCMGFEDGVSPIECCGRDAAHRLCEGHTQIIIEDIIKGMAAHPLELNEECILLFNVSGHVAARRCLSGEVCFPGTNYFGGRDGKLSEIKLFDKYKHVRCEVGLEDEIIDCCCIDRGLISFPLFDIGSASCFVYLSVVGASSCLCEAVRKDNKDKEKRDLSREYIAHFRHAVETIGMPLVMKYREQLFGEEKTTAGWRSMAHEYRKGFGALKNALKLARSERSSSLYPFWYSTTEDGKAERGLVVRPWLTSILDTAIGISFALDPVKEDYYGTHCIFGDELKNEFSLKRLTYAALDRAYDVALWHAFRDEPGEIENIERRKPQILKELNSCFSINEFDQIIVRTDDNVLIHQKQLAEVALYASLCNVIEAIFTSFRAYIKGTEDSFFKKAYEFVSARVTNNGLEVMNIGRKIKSTQSQRRVRTSGTAHVVNAVLKHSVWNGQKGVYTFGMVKEGDEFKVTKDALDSAGLCYWRMLIMWPFGPWT